MATYTELLDEVTKLREELQRAIPIEVAVTAILGWERGAVRTPICGACHIDHDLEGMDDWELDEWCETHPEEMCGASHCREIVAEYLRAQAKAQEASA